MPGSKPDKPAEEDFAAMFAASERDDRGGKRARRPQFQIGDKIRGKVASIGQEVTVVEIDGAVAGGKRHGHRAADLRSPLVSEERGELLAGRLRVVRHDAQVEQVFGLHRSPFRTSSVQCRFPVSELHS